MAVKHRLEVVADQLCEVLGAELSTADSKGNSPLWVALRSRQENIATKLVSEAGWYINSVSCHASYHKDGNKDTVCNVALGPRKGGEMTFAIER